MSTWTSEELSKIGEAEEVQIAPMKADGTLHKPVTIWVVRVGDDLYVRSARGHSGAWFRDARDHHVGHIQAGSVDKHVSFIEEADGTVNEKVDAAYLSKYRRYPQYVAPMVTAEVKSTTLKLVPRSTGP